MVKVLNIKGMMCAHCQAHVKEALEGLEGVTQAEVSLEDKRASVTMAQEISDESLTEAVTKAGYKVLACKTA